MSAPTEGNEKAGGEPAAAALVPARTPITLGQMVKLGGLAGTGGEAKWLINSGQVRVNGEVELRRGRKLTEGDTIEVDAARVVVASVDPGVDARGG